ncbi:hypothetical protein FRB90_003501, partial [Tulasnella sp. 427]
MDDDDHSLDDPDESDAERLSPFFELCSPQRTRAILRPASSAKYEAYIKKPFLDHRKGALWYGMLHTRPI